MISGCFISMLYCIILTSVKVFISMLYCSTTGGHRCRVDAVAQVADLRDAGA